MLRFLGLALLLAACAASDADPRDAFDGEASEDALETAEPAALTRVEAYETVAFEDRVVTANVVGGRDNNIDSLATGDRILVVRKLEYGGVPSVLAFEASKRRGVLVTRDALQSSTRLAVDADGPNRYEASLDAIRAADETLDQLEPATGATRAAVTIDMCQSSKPWERGLFDWFVDLANATGKAVPVGLAMTGGWAKTHPRELAQIRDWVVTGKLDVTWINHSYSHPLHCNADRSRCAFLTASNVDFAREVLDNERFMLRQNLGVSPLFRFPGLGHDARRRKELNDLGLFGLDANAWLAKGQPMKDRSVVLLHGNGNEPRGISMFLSAVQTQPWQRGLRDGTARFVSPLEAIVTP